MRKFWWLILILIVIGISYWFLNNREIEIINPLVKTEKIEKNTGWLAKYNFENLRKRENKASEIKTVGKVLVVEEARKELIKRGDLEGKKFNFESKAISFESNGKKISGMMNIPMTPMSNKLPTIIMIRGFAESEGYFIGSGSWKAADELARNGFITISLDFLGFGLSDSESTDILEARFEKPMSVLDLIESVKSLDIVDSEKIGIWAHSNGGQIAISVLEITGQSYPTVLWAPMTNPFPKSVLEMVDDQSEGSLKVKQRIEEFEKEYDSKLYSIDNFYDWIEVPILIHQGTADVWCKVEWQQDLQKKLKKLGKEVILDIKEGSDHNLKQSWQEVMDEDIKFFKEKFGI
ncbi:MAG: alpha/beta fold hydrolase [Candidatus Shapirobacteria bacterium]|nr:alpha/beta fold hydrolase [Candidatus Shapirobacteria bacterium]MDD4410269.1 alpha/beta fold hydrolase [Candidatus Shapirobacteria bacterium]